MIGWDIREGHQGVRAIVCAGGEGSLMIVGREAHVGVLRDALARARQGMASVTVLYGDAGIGKSALLADAVASDDDLLVLSASGHAAESDLPYAGLHQLLAPLTPAIGRLPEPQRRALSQALALESGLPGDQMATASAVLRLLTDQAETKTVVVVADDVQWLDQSTRQVLVFVARRIEADAVAMLLAQRGGLAEDLRTIGEPLLVGPMPKEESRELLRLTYPELSTMVAGKVIERAAGLPLALIEIPTELSPGQRAAREPLPSKFPVGEFIENLYQVRLGRLDDASRMALLIASYEDLEAGDLTRALASAGLGLAALDGAERSHLIRVEHGRCVFMHPTVRGAVQVAATSYEVARSHEALADCFATDPARYALYVQGCASVADEDVVAALCAAARQAQDQGGFTEAAVAWEAAATRAGDDLTRSDLRAQAVGCYLRSGSGRSALPLLTAMIEAAADELERARWLCVWVVTTMWVEGEPPEDTPKLVECGIGLLSGDAEHVRHGRDLLMALASCQFTWGTYAAGKDISDEVRRVIPTDELPIGHRLTCENLDVMVAAPGAGSFLRTNWIDDVLPEHMADPSVPIGFSGVALGWLDDLEGCERVARRCREITNAHTGLVATKLAIGSMSVIPMERAGDWDRAALEYANAERLAVDGDFVAPYPYIALRRAYLLAAQGKEAECHELRRRVADSVRRQSLALDHLDACVRGMLELTRGNYSQAVKTLEEAEDVEKRAGTIMSGLTSRFVDQFEAAWYVGRADEFHARLAEFTEIAQRLQHPTMLATAGRCRALLCDPADLDSAFEEVGRLQAPVPNHFEAARTQFLWGLRLRRARRKGEARRHLLDAEETFMRLGAVGWVAKTRSELAACGERRADSANDTAGPISLLTPREFEVAKAVAGGATNSDAAERLFISQRTVEYHLSSVYRKLAVGDRRSLAPFFAG